MTQAPRGQSLHRSREARRARPGGQLLGAGLAFPAERAPHPPRVQARPVTVPQGPRAIPGILPGALLFTTVAFPRRAGQQSSGQEERDLPNPRAEVTHATPAASRGPRRSGASTPGARGVGNRSARPGPGPAPTKPRPRWPRPATPSRPRPIREPRPEVSSPLSNCPPGPTQLRSPAPNLVPGNAPPAPPLLARGPAPCLRLPPSRG